MAKKPSENQKKKKSQKTHRTFNMRKTMHFDSIAGKTGSDTDA